MLTQGCFSLSACLQIYAMLFGINHISCLLLKEINISTTFFITEVWFCYQQLYCEVNFLKDDLNVKKILKMCLLCFVELIHLNLHVFKTSSC